MAANPTSQHGQPSPTQDGNGRRSPEIPVHPTARLPWGQTGFGQAAGANYTVWLVEMWPFPNNQTLPTDAVPQDALIRLGITQRLQQLFNRVAIQKGHGLRIGLRWLTESTLSQLQPQPRELVIYFTNSFQTGLVYPLLAQCAGSAAITAPTTGIPTAQQRALCGPLLTQFLPQQVFQRAPEDGLTFHTALGMADPQWVLSEVYAGTIIRQTFSMLGARNPYIADWADQWRLQVGRQIAHTAFHEAMHNKIEPAHTGTRNWDMHTRGGGGLAELCGWQRSETPANIRQLAAEIDRARPRQYVHGTHHLTFRAAPPARGPAAPPVPPDPFAGL